MHLGTLQKFYTVALTQNFTDAARPHSCTPAGASQSLHALEREFALPLAVCPDLGAVKLAPHPGRIHSGHVQIQDFFNAAGGGLMDSVKIVLFKILPRPAQIDKVRAEINRGLLKKYGRITRLEIDRPQRTITADLDLRGEKEPVQIRLASYRLHEAAGQLPRFEPGTVTASREWLDALLQTLVATGTIPDRLEIKNPLHQVVVKSLL